MSVQLSTPALLKFDLTMRVRNLCEKYSHSVHDTSASPLDVWLDFCFTRNVLRITDVHKRCNNQT